MINLPDPLHPAVVHFPIVLLLLGAPIAVLAVFVRKWHLPILACLLLVGGALGSFVAVGTGEADEEVAGELPPTGEAVLEKHEHSAERTRNFAVVAALFSMASVALFKFPLPASVVGGIAAVAALAAAFAVAETGHLGGQLVYKHGAGVNTLAGQASAADQGRASAGGKAEGGEKKKNHHDEDDDD